MFRSKTLPAAMAAMIALGAAGTAFASPGENSREIAAVLGAKTSITQAIAIAERQSGGRAMKIGVEKKNGAFLYEVKTVSKDRITEVVIDPASGKVVGTEGEGLIARMFNGEDQDELAKLDASPTTLAAAIATAERQIGGQAIEASVDDEDNTVRFEVEVARDNALHKVMIDGATGKVMTVALAESEDDDDDD